MNNKKVLIVCPYSAGSCGVFNRALLDAQALKELGYQVMIFSSNAIKGSKGEAKKEEIIGGIVIKRFPYVKLGGESFMYWDYKKEAITYAPDYIFVHNYRHLHTTQALKIKKLLNKKCFVILITHAPFIEKNETRSWLSSCTVDFYDSVIGPKTINRFDAIVAICNWEKDYLNKLGADINKTYCVPNAVPNEFFIEPFSPTINKSILFLGRVAPIKNILFILDLARIMSDYNFSIVGPVEEDYLYNLSLKHPRFPENVTLYPGIYDLQKKIKAYDVHKFFILPSLREAMPQALIEAMSRGKICICSDTFGAREVITNKDNGFICNTIQEAKDIILKQEVNPLEKNQIISNVQFNYSIDNIKQAYAKIFEDLNKNDK